MALYGTLKPDPQTQIDIYYSLNSSKRRMVRDSWGWIARVARLGLCGVYTFMRKP
jgi:hypothetical protein